MALQQADQLPKTCGLCVPAGGQATTAAAGMGAEANLLLQGSRAAKRHPCCAVGRASLEYCTAAAASVTSSLQLVLPGLGANRLHAWLLPAQVPGLT